MAEAHREEIAKLEALYAAHPEGRVFTHLAEAYRRAGDLNRAREILEDGLRRHPDYSSAHVVFGRVLMDLGEASAAAAAFRRVLELDRHNLIALRSLGDLAERNVETAAAIGYYRELLALDPTDDRLRVTVARLEEELRAGATLEPVAGEETAPGLEPSSEEVTEEVPGEGVEGGQFAEFEGVPPVGLESVAGPPYGEDLPAGEPEELGGLTLEWMAEPVQETDFPDLPGGDLEIESAELTLSEAELEIAEPTEPFAGFGWLDEQAASDVLDAQGGEAFPEEGVAGEEIRAPADDEIWQSMGERAEAAWDSVDEQSDAPVPPPEDVIEEVTTWGPPVDEPSATVVEEETVSVGVEGQGQAFPQGAGESSAEVLTETMAELYARQGFYDRAVEVYRQLLEQVPEDTRLRDRLREIEALEAAAGESRLEQPAAGPWAAPPDVADIDSEAWVESVESAWTGRAGVAGAEETPYAWAGSPTADEGATPSSTTAGEYFRRLLGWRPAQAPPTAGAAEDVLELTDEHAVEAPPAGEAEEIALDAGAVEAAFEEWFGGEPAAGGAAAGPTRGEVEEPSEADADLEMFRSWLQSLKK